MQTDTITLTCLTNSDGFNCSTPSFFSGGDMFISLLLIIFLVISIIYLAIKAIFYVKIHKNYDIRHSDFLSKENINI